MTDTIKVVVVLVVSEDGNEVYSNTVDDGDEANAMECTQEGALERYEENVGSLPPASRVIHMVLDVPAPKVSATILRAAVPEEEALPEVKMTVS